MIFQDHYSGIFTSSGLLASILVYVLLAFLVSYLRSPRYPKSVRWVGTGKSLLAGLWEAPDWIQSGYEMYSKNDEIFGIPGILGGTPEVVIPRSQMSWLIDQPDHVLSTAQAHHEVLHGDYNFLTKDILGTLYHEHVIHRSLPRQLNELLPEIDDEVRRSVDENLGLDDTQWKTAKIWDLLLQFIPRVTNRMIVGAPLCRTPGYIKAMGDITNDITRNMLILAITPQALRPIIGSAAALANKYHFFQSTRYTIPLIKKRLADFAFSPSPKDAVRDLPNDYVTWHIALAHAEGVTKELTPHRIAQRLVPLNFASIHTTALTALNTLLDIMAADNGSGTVIASLREEAVRVHAEELAQGHSSWTKGGLARLYRIDSAIRESMRVSAFAQTMVQKKVIAPGGVTNPKTGWHFEKGTILSCPLWGAQHDPDFYGENANTFDAFRFSREREAYEVKEGEKNVEEGLKLKRMGIVTTSDTHMAFGHGRHACPGRFFVAHELKMFLAYIFLNYEVKPLKERPSATWVGKQVIPPINSKIEFRRKPSTVRN